MILACDVAYQDTDAFAAGVLFDGWNSSTIEQRICLRVGGVASYRSGALFKRELPCLLKLLEELDVPPSAILVDGYVTLGRDNSPGLGAHLHNALRKEIPVVGVAKTRFRDTPSDHEVLRGQSRKPLFVTSAGMELETARAAIVQMHGPYRIPTMLSECDKLCRDFAKTQLDDA